MSTKTISNLIALCSCPYLCAVFLFLANLTVVCTVCTCSVWFVLLVSRSKGHKSRKKAKERREEEERVAARERALQDEVTRKPPDTRVYLPTYHCVCAY